MRLDYQPVVDIRRAKTRCSSGGASTDESRMAAIEATKYATKATDLMSMGSALGMFHFAIKGLRLSSSSRSLKPYISSTPISEQELVDKPMDEDVPIVRGKALWFEDIQEYLFTDIL